METDKRAKVFAHRGFSFAYPENTLPAFQAAIELGVDGLEFDIHLSKDGEIVVTHDERLERTSNGHGLVASHTLAELKQLDVGSWFNPSFHGERIPTLAEVLDLVQRAGRSVQLNIESKSGIVPYPGLEERAFLMAAERGLAESVVFSSFNHFALRDLKQARPAARIGILYMEGLVDPWLYASRLQAEALHPFYLSFDESVVQGAHRHGLSVMPFTANTEVDMARLQDWGVDAIITDRPDVLLSMQGRGGNV